MFCRDKGAAKAEERFCEKKRRAVQSPPSTDHRVFPHSPFPPFAHSPRPLRDYDNVALPAVRPSPRRPESSSWAASSSKGAMLPGRCFRVFPLIRCSVLHIDLRHHRGGPYRHDRPCIRFNAYKNKVQTTHNVPALCSAKHWCTMPAAPLQPSEVKILNTNDSAKKGQAVPAKDTEVTWPKVEFVSSMSGYVLPSSRLPAPGSVDNHCSW